MLCPPSLPQFCLTHPKAEKNKFNKNILFDRLYTLEYIYLTVALVASYRSETNKKPALKKNPVHINMHIKTPHRCLINI